MQEPDKFLNPRLTPSFSDSYIVRNAILLALSRQLYQFKGVLLDIGCGNQPYKPILITNPSQVNHYIGLDIVGNIYHPPDIYWNGKSIPIKERSVDCSIATEFLEHCPDPEEILGEIYRVLKPGGILFFTVPFLWPLHDTPGDEYRYTPFALDRMIRKAGFSNSTLEAMGGWDASFAQMIGLWINRRPMGQMKRKIARWFAFPIIKYLLKQDHLPQEFGEGVMITGISGIAVK